MLRLIRRRDQERGAIAVIAALVVGSLVLTGVAALAVDAGSLYAERRVVQNGADAASLELAAACARNDPAKCSALSPDLKDLANLNSPDQLTDIDSVCFSTDPCGLAITLLAKRVTPPPPTLVECTKLPPSLLPSLPSMPKWVEVRTKTHSTDPANSSVVRRFFADLFNSSYDGVSVKACARAAWGPAGAIKPTLPFTFSACEWYTDTLPGGNYAPNRPPNSSANNPWEHAVVLNGAPTAGCTNWQGHDFPGGFGWLDYDPANCQIAAPIDGWYGGDTGVGAGNQCGAKIQAAVGTVVFMPVFDCADDDQRRLPCAGTLPNGTNAWYHVQGVAAFFLTGVEITGQLNKSLPGYPKKPARDECKADLSGNKKCLYGWFLSGLVAPGTVLGPPGGSNLGVIAVQVAG